MVACCRCNRTGVCQGCACVKAKRPCSSCLPSRLGTCLNCQPSSPESLDREESDLDVDISSFVSDVPPLDSTSVSSVPALPSFVPSADPLFSWGSLDGVQCVSAISECYFTAVHWRPNLFRVPSGKVGEAFIQDLSQLFKSYAGSSSALESIALTAAMLMPLLLLQCPFKGANHKELISHLDRRLTLWRDGAFFDLLHEGESIQARLPKSSTSTACDVDSDLNRLFTHHMTNGNVKSALRLLSNGGKGKVLSLDQLSDPSSTSTVRDVLLSKHPPPGPICPDSVLLRETPSPILMIPIPLSLILSMVI